MRMKSSSVIGGVVIFLLSFAQTAIAQTTAISGEQMLAELMRRNRSDGTVHEFPPTIGPAIPGCVSLGVIEEKQVNQKIIDCAAGTVTYRTATIFIDYGLNSDGEKAICQRAAKIIQVTFKYDCATGKNK